MTGGSYNTSDMRLRFDNTNRYVWLWNLLWSASLLSTLLLSHNDVMTLTHYICK